MKDIDSYLEQLSPEERERYKALIQETEERAKFIEESTSRSEQLLKKRDQALSKIKDNLEHSGDVIENVGKSMAAIHANGDHAREALGNSCSKIDDLNLKIDLYKFELECILKETENKD